MNELVHWMVHSRFLASARVPSLAGSGLPERMRSTAFALLGLTAAAGLALVAIFAQLGFPLLEPAPLPAEPTVNESIATAEEAAPGRSRVALRRAQPAPPTRRGEASSGQPSSGGASGSPVEEGPASGPGGAVAPAPGAVPESSGGHKNGGGTGGEPGGSNPDPTAAPEPAPVAIPAPGPTAPAPSAPVPKPAAPPPAPVAAIPASEPVAPGNSSSAAAAAHASERGIEASSGNGNAK